MEQFPLPERKIQIENALKIVKQWKVSKYENGTLGLEEFLSKNH